MMASMKDRNNVNGFSLSILIAKIKEVFHTENSSYVAKVESD